MDEKRLGAVGSGHEEMRRLAGTLAPPALPQRLKRISSGQFSREMGKVSVRHYRYFFTISQQKPRKRYFGEKYLKYYSGIGVSPVSSGIKIHPTFWRGVQEGLKFHPTHFPLHPHAREMESSGV